MLEIKTMNAFDEDSLDFLIKESYRLFCKLKNHNSLSQELKEKLKQMYIINQQKNDKIYVAYKDNMIVGCAYITEKGYLRDMFVKEEYQKQHIGSIILKKIIDDKSETEIILDAHHDVVNFYEKHNFIVLEENKESIKMKRL